MSVDIDLDDAFDELEPNEQKDFIIDHIDLLEGDDFATIAARDICIDEILKYYSTLEIELWLDDYAGEYGYVQKGGATSAEQELCNIAQEKMEAILSVIAHSSNINPEAVIISWQASDGFIFTDGDWEYCPTHDELVELLSMKGGE